MAVAEAEVDGGEGDSSVPLGVGWTGSRVQVDDGGGSDECRSIEGCREVRNGDGDAEGKMEIHRRRVEAR